jgi:hypothetical protein
LPVNPSGNVVLRLCAPARFECWQHRQIDGLRARSDPKTATESRTQCASVVRGERRGGPWARSRQPNDGHAATRSGFGPYAVDTVARGKPALSPGNTSPENGERSSHRY